MVVHNFLEYWLDIQVADSAGIDLVVDMFHPAEDTDQDIGLLVDNHVEDTVEVQRADAADLVVVYNLAAVGC